MKENERSYIFKGAQIPEKRGELVRALAEKGYDYNIPMKNIYQRGLLIGTLEGQKINIRIANHPEGKKLAEILSKIDL